MCIRDRYWDYVDEDLEKSMQGKSRITFYLLDSETGYSQLAQVRIALQKLKEERSDCGSLLLTIMGSLYVESIFSVPGMGGLLINVIQRQDNTMVQALVLIFASMGIIGLFLGDLMMIIVDPRISLNRGEASR